MLTCHSGRSKVVLVKMSKTTTPTSSALKLHSYTISILFLIIYHF